MSRKKRLRPQKAKYPDKTIELRVRFFTNGITKGKDMIIPKHCWDKGMVVMDKNRNHGLVQRKPLPFNSILELPATLAKLLARDGVLLHPGNKLSKILDG